jgi:hypothetical protein
MPAFGPLASYPLAGSGDSSILLNLSDSLAGMDVPYGLSWPLLVESITASSEFTPDVLANLIERISVAAATNFTAILAGKAFDSVAFSDTVLAAWQLLVAENIALAGEAAGTVNKLAALADALAATGQASNNLTAMAACIEAIALEGLLRLGFNADAVEGATLADACANTARLLGPLADAVLGTDDATPMLRLSMIAADSVDTDDAATALLRANADLSDSVLFYATLRIGGTDYVGWALNTDLKAATQYSNTPFLSFESFKGRHYAAGAGGIVEFTGTKDDGADIDWSLKTFLMDFGSSKQKRLPDVFIGATSSGQLVLKVITRTPGTGVICEDYYAAERLPAAEAGVGRVQVGRGLRSTFWQLELTSVNGADFALDSIAFRPIVLDRRT